MERILTAIRSIYHFEPLSEMALQRYSITRDGSLDFHDKLADTDVDFVLAVMELYSGSAAFRKEDFARFSFSTVLEFLERTHVFYEMSILPKLEQSIEQLKRVFPDHAVAHLLDAFFNRYKRGLLAHIDLEETLLFPYARRLSHGGSTRDYSVGQFEEQHDHAVEEELDRLIVSLEKAFPEVARSFAFRTFKTLLEHFRIDLSIHHLIEEQVFVPKVLEMEQRQSALPFQ